MNECSECTAKEFWKFYIHYMYLNLFYHLYFVKTRKSLTVSWFSTDFSILQSLLYLPETLNPVALSQFTTLWRMYGLLNFLYIFCVTQVVHTILSLQIVSARTDSTENRLSHILRRRNYFICATYKLCIRLCIRNDNAVLLSAVTR
jgi:hypothetical protein